MRTSAKTQADQYCYILRDGDVDITDLKNENTLQKEDYGFCQFQYYNTTS